MRRLADPQLIAGCGQRGHQVPVVVGILDGDQYVDDWFGSQARNRRGPDVLHTEGPPAEGVLDPNALGLKSSRPTVVIVGDHDLPLLAAADEDVVMVWVPPLIWHPRQSSDFSSPRATSSDRPRSDRESARRLCADWSRQLPGWSAPVVTPDSEVGLTGLPAMVAASCARDLTPSSR
jgi:hypothetical protein